MAYLELSARVFHGATLGDLQQHEANFEAAGKPKATQIMAALRQLHVNATGQA